MWVAALLCGTQAAVLPPPWADVKRNPCASHPRGWLMLYWPSDGKCYTIYKVIKQRYLTHKGHHFTVVSGWVHCKIKLNHVSIRNLKSTIYYTIV